MRNTKLGCVISHNVEKKHKKGERNKATTTTKGWSEDGEEMMVGIDPIY